MKTNFKHGDLEFKSQSTFNREIGTACAGQQPTYKTVRQWFVYKNGKYIGVVIANENATRQQIIEKFT